MHISFKNVGTDLHTSKEYRSFYLGINLLKKYFNYCSEATALQTPLLETERLITGQI